MAGCAVGQPRATVAAEIVEGAHLAIAAPDDERAFIEEVVE